MKERYGELPPHIRNFLEALDIHQVEALKDLMDFRSDLPAHSREMLRGMDKETAKWLKGARPDEIAQLVEGIRLVRSSRTVGKFLRWAVVTLIGAFILMSQLGEHLSKFFRWVRGG